MGSSRDRRLVLTGQGDLISGVMGGNGGYVGHQLPVLPPCPTSHAFGLKRGFLQLESCVSQGQEPRDSSFLWRVAINSLLC